MLPSFQNERKRRNGEGGKEDRREGRTERRGNKQKQSH